MARGKRQPVYDADGTKLVGIFRDNIGHAIIVKVGGEQFEKRAAAEADPAKLVALRESWKVRLEDTHGAKRGTLRGDVGEYLTTLPAGSLRKKNAVKDLQPWLDWPLESHDKKLTIILGDEPTKKVTSAEIRRAISQWRAEGFAASTINHRRQELSNVFTALNGRSGANPVRDTSRIAEVYDEPRGIPQLLVRLILKCVDERVYKVRLRVIATTGLPPAQIARLQRHDFDARARTVFVRPRRKGAGVKGKTLPLTRRAVSALLAYFAAEIQGWSHSRTRGAFHAAVERAKDIWYRCRDSREAEGRTRLLPPWPAHSDLVPYDLRHAFLTHAYRKTRDLRAVAELGLHSDMKTTQRYAEAAVTETARKAVSQIE